MAKGKSLQSIIITQNETTDKQTDGQTDRCTLLISNREILKGNNTVAKTEVKSVVQLHTWLVPSETDIWSQLFLLWVDNGTFATSAFRKAEITKHFSTCADMTHSLLHFRLLSAWKNFCYFVYFVHSFSWHQFEPTCYQWHSTTRPLS